MALIKCNGCGQMVSNHANFCPHCGGAVNNNDNINDIELLNDNVELEDYNSPAPATKKKSVARWLIVIVTLCLLSIGGFYASTQFFHTDLFNNNDALNNPPEPVYSEELIIKAEQGDAEAQRDLGRCYHKGIGVELNYSKAVHWYRKAAKQGDA